MTQHAQGTVALVGVGECGYARRSTVPVPALALAAAKQALDDSGIAASEVDAIVTEARVVPEIIDPDEMAAGLGLTDHVFSAEMSVAGAGIVAAPLIAKALINAKLANVVLAYSAVAYGSAPDGPYAFHASDQYKASLEIPFGFYGQPVYFGPVLQRYYHETDLEPKQVADFVVSTRAWASANPTAILREQITAADYFDSPIIADPIRVLDCCLVNDGAAAFVMTSVERARDLPSRPVIAAGFAHSSSPLSGHSYLTQRVDYLHTQARVTAPRALDMAGIRAEDLDFAEIYDCFTVSCLMQIVDSGLCPLDGLGEFISNGRTGPNGSFPINTHGGQLSQAYTLGASHVVEAVHQLRGTAGARQLDNARLGLVSGYGGWDATSLVLAADSLS